MLASAGLLAVALKARWHLLVPLWTTGVICDLLFGQVNGRKRQAVHWAGGCLSSQSKSLADTGETVYCHFCPLGCCYHHLLSYLFLAGTEGKVGKQVAQQIQILFATRLLLGVCHAQYHLWIAILQHKKWRKEMKKSQRILEASSRVLILCSVTLMDK